MWVMMSRLWRKDIKESMQVGECLYQLTLENPESSGVMRKLETKGADEPVTKEEWDEFATCGVNGQAGTPLKCLAVLSHMLALV
ncbi:hypothetical protein Bca52824_053922 [Brassica carinata]|uniref:Uncharacterized protein n=1 Tax=Brassica carinata TaxID=52824 RepID=A0A8X7R7G1_BRACI|nr:hypothetical protein Bca52824_053922 [Brassica carinata]